MKKLHIVLMTSIYVGLFGCGDATSNIAVTNETPHSSIKKEKIATKILGISDYEFFFNDQPGKNITFSIPSAEECTLTFAKSSFAINFNATTNIAEGGKFDLSCLTRAGLFILDDSKQTFATMNITELTPTHATIVVGAKLYAVRKKEFLNLENIVMTITENELLSIRE